MMELTQNLLFFLQLFGLISPQIGVETSFLILKEYGLPEAPEKVGEFLNILAAQGTSFSTSFINFTTVDEAVQDLNYKAKQEAHPSAIIILSITSSVINLKMKCFQSEFNANVFHGVIQMNQNGINLQYWDSYKFKNSEFHSKLQEIENKESYQEQMEYGIMVKVKRRSNLESSEIVAVVASNDLNAVLSRVDAPRQSLSLKLAEYTQTVAIDAFLDLQMLFNFRFLLISDRDPNKLLSASNETGDIRGDINCQFIAQTLERFKQFTLLQPMLHSKYNAFFKKPNLSSIRNAHLQPFHNLVWICIILTWILYFFVLYGMKYSYKHYIYERAGQVARHVLKDVHGGWWILAFITGKVPGHPADLLPFLRICFLTGSLTGMIIQIFYSSTILSAITVVISPIKNFDNLIQLNFHFTTHVLSMPMQDVIMKIIEDKHLSQGLETVDNTNQITHLLNQDTVSTITYSDAFYREAFHQNYTTNFLCEKIAAVPLTSFGRAFPISFITRKDSEFTELFNYGITKIMERGLHRRYDRQYNMFQRNLACRSISGGNVVWDTVDLTETVIPFSCYFVGMAIALLLLFLEKFKNSREFSL